MKNEKIVKRLNQELKQALQATVRGHEIDKVVDNILKILDDSSLSPIEMFGVLEVVRHIIHEDVHVDICNDCAKKLGLQEKQNAKQ